MPRVVHHGRDLGSNEQEWGNDSSVGAVSGYRSTQYDPLLTLCIQSLSCEA